MFNIQLNFSTFFQDNSPFLIKDLYICKDVNAILFVLCGSRHLLKIISSLSLISNIRNTSDIRYAEIPLWQLWRIWQTL